MTARIPQPKLQPRGSFYRTIITLLLLLIFVTGSKAQTNLWTWMSGDNTANQAGSYGVQGTAALTNKPGNRDSYCSWQDASGNFWIFGGWDINNNMYNDLWKYTVSSGQWTWMSGDNTTNQKGVYGTRLSPATTNKPGARFGAAFWKDASGNFWLFGGYGYYTSTTTQGYLNDLWKYDPIANKWTWISGDNNRNKAGVYGLQGVANATNKPGSRYYPAGWTDASGNCWIFGGGGYDASTTVGYLNDLWKYDPIADKWTWVSGDNTINNGSSYGAKGTAAASNKPGGRYIHSGFSDASGNFWIYAGQGLNAAGSTVGYLNDLWKYNPTAGQWTWVSGENLLNSTGIYGVKGTAATSNEPGGRFGPAALKSATANLIYVYGGIGYDGAGATGSLNDLWAYSITGNKWTWISNDNAVNTNGGIFGIKGIGVAANKPPGRGFISAWLDASGNLWSFGGYDNGVNDFNDLWEFSALSALPLQNISLQGTHHNEANQLHWQTQGETNTQLFFVERSTNGNNFTIIGTVAAMGVGNNSYTYTDNAAPDGICYYRIQAKDLDGQTHYSAMITITTQGSNRISIYPNPATTSVVLRITDMSLLNTTAKIFNTAGQLIQEFRINSTEQPISLQGLSKGVFTVRLSNGKAYSFIKE